MPSFEIQEYLAQLSGSAGVDPLPENFQYEFLEDAAMRFVWHAEFFDGPFDSRQPARRTVIQADNADEAEKIARSQMGISKRVEVTRAATTAPARTVYAREEAAKILSSIEIVPLQSAPNAAILA
jgi:hypothetical protein